MKKIFALLLILLLLNNYAYALSKKECENYIGRFCYIKHYKYDNSEIAIYDKTIGKIMTFIEERELKILVIDYYLDAKYIKLRKIIDIKILR